MFTSPFGSLYTDPLPKNLSIKTGREFPKEMSLKRNFQLIQATSKALQDAKRIRNDISSVCPKNNDLGDEERKDYENVIAKSSDIEKLLDDRLNSELSWLLKHLDRTGILFKECTICLNSFIKEPYILACGHIFCKTCTETLVDMEDIDDDDRSECEAYTCPVCRSEWEYKPTKLYL